MPTIGISCIVLRTSSVDIMPARVTPLTVRDAGVTRFRKGVGIIMHPFRDIEDPITGIAHPGLSTEPAVKFLASTCEKAAYIL